MTDAIAQIPAAYRKDLLIRADGAGASHKLLSVLAWIIEQGKVRGRKVEYSVGFAVTEKIRDAIKLVRKNVWTPLRVPEPWPWAAAIVAVFANIATIPQPA